MLAWESKFVEDRYWHQAYYNIGDDVQGGIGEPNSQATQTVAAYAVIPEVGDWRAHECSAEDRPESVDNDDSD